MVEWKGKGRNEVLETILRSNRKAVAEDCMVTCCVERVAHLEMLIITLDFPGWGSLFLNPLSKVLLPYLLQYHQSGSRGVP